nr:RNA-directed DNA polymerase, eukaryota, reverse transcriptase zinc-binding domain protein [Tanacetum cinerariifolium]
MGDWRSHPSKEDLTQKISTSVFVINFPEQFSSRDLWRTCQVYGRVVDAFIPNRRSRTGLRFGFVRFIQLKDVDRLVGNLCTIWVDHHRLHANVARFQRPSLKNVSNGNRFNENTKLHTGGSNKGYDGIDKGIPMRGKSFWVRAKEVSGWVPDFMEDENEEEYSDGEMGDIDAEKLKEYSNNECNSTTDSDVEEVSETVFEAARDDNSQERANTKEDQELHSADPFNIYGLLNKNQHGDKKDSVESLDTLKFPPGFTPEDNEASNSNTKKSSKVEGNVSCCSGHFRQTEDPPTGGSMLQLLEDVVKVGQTMGYKMDGCVRNIEEIIDIQGKFLKKVVMELLRSRDWMGETIIMGDFNEVHFKEERHGSTFNAHSAAIFNSFIISSSLAEDLEKLESIEVAQKVKIKWLIEGDENSKYYHGLLNKSRNQLSIRGVLSDDQKEDLERMVSKEEIKSAVWDCGVDKSRGPDEFTFGFYRRYWSMLESDVVDAVSYFFNHGKFPKGGNSSFIALIPKLQDAKLVKYFRPISLIGSLYKIIAKVLSNRLVGVLGGLVNEVQLAFVSDRQILDGPEANIDTIVNALKWFHLAFGLRMNLHKSKLMGIAIENDKIAKAANKIGCLTLKKSFSYLGIKVGGLMSRVNSWYKVVDSLYARLSKWKIKTLSIDGRLTLLKSVLGSMPIYYMSLFKVPFQVLNKMEAIRSHFFNGAEAHENKMCCVKWNREETWRRDHSFSTSFPRIFSLEDYKSITVARKMAHDDLPFSLRRNPRDGAEVMQFSELKAILDGLLLSSAQDRWSWSIDGSEEFSVASTRRLLDDHLL